MVHDASNTVIGEATKTVETVGTPTPTGTPAPTPTEPSLQSSSVTDNSDATGKASDRKARYTVSYQITDPDNRFDRVEVTVTPQGGTSETLKSTSAPAGSVTYTGPDAAEKRYD